MTGLQLALLGGALVGAGVALVVHQLVPTHPDLRETLERLSPHAAHRQAQARRQRLSGSDDARDVLGAWAQRVIPSSLWGRVPHQDLAILRITVPRFYGEKVTFALLGLVIGPLLGSFFAIIGLGVPVVVPVLGSLALASLLWFLPDYNVRDDAKQARLEFTRALGAYIDLVALERNAGSGPRQAMEVAATIGDSWVFARISEELARTRWSGLTPWDALRHLGEEFGLSELHDLADIMRLSGEDGAQIYANLRARSAGMRSAMLSAEKAKANEVSERMTVPMSLLGIIFMAILITPAMLRILG